MNPVLLFPAGISESCRSASKFLEQHGFLLTDHPSPDITHLLLDIPSFDCRGMLRDGSDLEKLLRMLPQTITIIGGNLENSSITNYRKIDLLKDPVFLAKNAAITAECALQITAPYIDFTFADSRVLILGWGRIGKCLSKLLKTMGCHVTVAARKDTDRAILEALGYAAVDFPEVPQVLKKHNILFNTVPEQILKEELLNLWKDGIKVDLASAPGMICDNVVTARGLPGKYAPESAGRLIAQTVRRLL